jgi:signal transduction histidine kinase
MKRGPFYLTVLCGLAVVFLSLLGFVNMLERPGISGFRNRPALPKDPSEPAILSIDGIRLQDSRDIDFILSQKAIGDEVTYELRTAKGVEPVRTRLIRYYEAAPPVFLTIGILGFIIGFLVFFLRSGERQARIFYYATLAFGPAVMISGDLYGCHAGGGSLLPGILFNFAYPLAPVLLWRFSRTFTPRPEKNWFTYFWTVPLGFGAALNFGFLYSQLRPSLQAFRISQDWLFVFRAYLAIACVAAVVELVRAFRKSDSDMVRAQIKWILLGSVVGLSPFIFLYQMPQVIGGAGAEVIREDTSCVFLVLIPVAIAIAVLKYRLMNVNIVINRSLVYSLLTVFTVGVYLLSAEALGHLFTRASLVQADWISLGAAFVAAMVFQPGRKRIQSLVDRTFFRQAHDYRKAALDFNARAAKIMSPSELISEFLEAVPAALPLDRLGVQVYEPAGGDVRLILSEGLDDRADRALRTLPEPREGSWAREEAVRLTQGMDFSKQDVLKTLGLDLVMPLPFESAARSGWLAAGRKKSGERFTMDDLELLETMAAELVAGLNKIRLQEQVIYERASREKADEVSRLKTEFISSVSHELRTPMSSLQSLSELLQSGKIQDASRRERLLQLMAAECGRLSRFVHNVLDFGKIEQGSAHYEMRTAAVQPLIQEVIDLYRPGAAPEELVVKAEMPETPVLLEADQDAVRQALLNLVDNAIKYSEARKEVTIRLVPGQESVEIQVEDRGIGIEPEDREKIFEAFFRSPRAARHNPKGVGLGLKIVKHIMDAHGGTIGLQSEPGKGSTFSLIFPLRRTS